MSPRTDTPEGLQDRAKPETLRGRSLSASLTVRDLPASLAWYRDVAGFVVEKTYEGEGTMQGASILAGSVHLVLTQDDGSKGWDRTKGVGLRFYLDTAQDVDELAAAVEARGGTLAEGPHDRWGSRAFSLEDPDGFKLTITREA